MEFPFLAPAVAQALYLGVKLVRELQRNLWVQWKLWAVWGSSPCVALSLPRECVCVCLSRCVLTHMCVHVPV